MPLAAPLAAARSGATLAPTGPSPFESSPSSLDARAAPLLLPPPSPAADATPHPDETAVVVPRALVDACCEERFRGSTETLAPRAKSSAWEEAEEAGTAAPAAAAGGGDALRSGTAARAEGAPGLPPPVPRKTEAAELTRRADGVPRDGTRPLRPPLRSLGVAYALSCAARAAEDAVGGVGRCGDVGESGEGGGDGGVGPRTGRPLWATAAAPAPGEPGLESCS